MRNRAPLSLLSRALGLACLLVSPAAALAAPGIFTSVAPREGLVAQDAPEVVRSRYVALDLAALPKVGDEATFNFFPGLESRVHIHRVESAYAGGQVFVGRIVDRPLSEVFVSIYQDAAVINARDPLSGVFFEVKPAGQGVFAVNQINEDALPGCEVVADEALLNAMRLTPMNIEEPGDGSGPTVIDVLILFTPAAQSQAGGLNGMTATLNSYVTTTNNAYNNSLINQQIRLVHAALTNYVEAASMGTDLGRLSGSGDGFMDEVHSLRNTYGADLCHLVSGAANGACGIANLGGNNSGVAFAVTARSCGAYTFAHELGHNMGCCHAPNDGGGCGTGGFFCYSTGWRSLDQQYRDIMAYSPGTRIPYFSNPLITLQLGANMYTIGVPDPPGCSQAPPNYAADNARTMNITRLNITNYRPTQVGNPPPEAFNLLTPPDGATGISTGPALGWQAANFAAEYSVILSPNPDLSDPVFEDNTTSLSVGVPLGTLNHGAWYYWTVTASNLGGQTPAASGIYEFKVRPLGDASGNGVVDFADLNIVLGQFGQSGGGLAGDINSDGIVNFADLNIVLANFGAS